MQGQRPGRGWGLTACVSCLRTARGRAWLVFLVVLVLIPCAALALFIATADVFIAAEDPLHGGVHSDEVYNEGIAFRLLSTMCSLATLPAWNVITAQFGHRTAHGDAADHTSSGARDGGGGAAAYGSARSLASAGKAAAAGLGAGAGGLGVDRHKLWHRIQSAVLLVIFVSPLSYNLYFICVDIKEIHQDALAKVLAIVQMVVSIIFQCRATLALQTFGTEHLQPPGANGFPLKFKVALGYMIVFCFQRVLVFASFPALSTQRFGDLYHTLTPNVAAWMLSIVRPLSTVFLWRVLVDLCTVFEACLALHQRRVSAQSGGVLGRPADSDGVGDDVADIDVSAAFFTAPGAVEAPDDGLDVGGAGSDDDEWQLVNVVRHGAGAGDGAVQAAGDDALGDLEAGESKAGGREREVGDPGYANAPQGAAVAGGDLGDGIAVAATGPASHAPGMPAPDAVARSGTAVVSGGDGSRLDQDGIELTAVHGAGSMPGSAQVGLALAGASLGSSQRSALAAVMRHASARGSRGFGRGAGTAGLPPWVRQAGTRYGAVVGVFIVGWLMALEMFDENDIDDRCIVVTIQVITVVLASLACVANLVIERHHWSFRPTTVNVVLLVSALFTLLTHVLDFFRELPRCPTIISASIVWTVAQTAVVFNRRAWPVLLAFLLFLNLGWTFSTLLLEAHHMEQAVERGHDDLNVELVQTCLFWLTLEYHVAITEVMLERLLLPLLSSFIVSIVTHTVALTGAPAAAAGMHGASAEGSSKVRAATSAAAAGAESKRA